MKTPIEKIKTILKESTKDLPLQDKVSLLNEIKLELRKFSPFSNEPVDCVIWVPALDVFANDYNPNAVAPPEMKLLELSVKEDGFTQPTI